METKNGFFIKDLRILKNRELKDIVIVDNLVHSFGFQIGKRCFQSWNLPMIPATWSWDISQTTFLKGHYYPDLRDYNRENLRLAEMAQKKFEEIEERV